VAFAISAAIAERRAEGADREVRWVMTSAWTFPQSTMKRQLLTPITRRLFQRIAYLYSFITMPPMPPDPAETEERAVSVLRAVRLARLAASRGGMIGLAPEGMDTPQVLGDPPPGAGRFVALLVEAGLPVLPAGFRESLHRLRVSFGPAFVPKVPQRGAERDKVVIDQVMDAISAQLVVT
jgi:hypothetical protein